MSTSKQKNESSNRAAEHKVSYLNHIGGIVRDYGEHYIKQYQPHLQQIKLLRAMRLCKSPALGGKAIVCKSCFNYHYVYHSCGHSHCPICQSIKREQWVDKLKKELLNVPYLHMIFTLPHQLNGLARNNKDVIYSLIMKSSWNTVKTLAEKEENVGALPGMINVLHTFGSDMKYHIHTHCLVTFGGWNQTSNSWKVPKRKEKIARYRQINSTYKNIFLEGLKILFAKGEIEYHQSFDQVFECVNKLSWVVHNTKPTIDTQILEDYLARYVNRVAVTNSRIEYLKEQRIVKLIYNDYANQLEGEPAPKIVKPFDPLSFIHQFMQHVLPPYFQKSRRYGLHASATKKKLNTDLPESILRDGMLIRTLMQIVAQLIKQNPFQCQFCQSQEYQILEIKPDKNWITKFVKIPNQRPPPIKFNIECLHI